MLNYINTIALIFSGIALFIAFWQTQIAKSQLNQSKETKNETEKLLDEIKEKTSKIETISDETRKDVKEQISKLIDKQDETIKTLLNSINSPREDSQNQMIASLLPKLIENPEMMDKMMEFGNKSKK
ncbi:MAG: hypothetical protein KAT32_03935 [Candidatus Moranbacteria bacterium]|nr:hypothetical protein [Candidatus Moranbacteria bacterium]